MEETTYKISASPHVRDRKTTSSLMLDVVIALLPASVFGVYNFGIQAFVLILTCIASCVFFEWAAERLLHRKTTVGDFSAVVTGLLLALNLSPDVPAWMAVLGSAFAIIVVKQLFGGLGQNFMNPALAARCFLLISFAGQMTTFSYDGVTTATPLAVLKNGGTVDVLDMFFGTTAGTIGETSTVCLLVGALYLIVRRVIRPVIPLVYIGTFSVFVCIYRFASGAGLEPLYLAAQLCGGGLMLGAFYMATDYVTSPITKHGRVVYGVLLGVLTFLFRFYGSSAEGVSYAIIIGNLFVPLIERVTQPKSFGKGAELAAEQDAPEPAAKMDKKSIGIAVAAILVITLVSGGVLAYVEQVTKEPIEQAEQKATEDAYREVFAEADSFELLSGDAFDAEETSAYLSEQGYSNVDIDAVAVAYDTEKNALGYVLTITSHEAYDGDLQLTLGVTSSGMTNGISFLSINETAGLGMEADTDAFKSQFAGKTVSQFEYTKSGAASEEEIDALSGATITTNAVTNAVNAGLVYAAYLEGGND